MIKPSDMDRWTPTQGVCVLLSPCDPPCYDHVRALDAAFDQGGQRTVWLCPLFNDDEQAKRSRLCSQVLCSDYYSSSHRPVGFCSVALDKRMTKLSEFSGWFKERFPSSLLKTAMLACESDGFDPDVVVTFAGQETFEAKHKWVLGKYLPSPPDLAKRIMGGADESRRFPASVWDFLIEKGLYRRK